MADGAMEMAGEPTVELSVRDLFAIDTNMTVKAFAEPTRAAIESADPANPGVQPRPALGIQFVDIPEFPDLGTQVSQEISSAIAGKTSVDEALDNGQALAEDVAERYKAREGDQ